MAWQRKTDAPYVVVTDAGFWSAALARFTWLQFLAPTLGGEVIDVTTFCAAGPEWSPPVTMADIIILGVAEDWQRPHTLLSVTHAIARQELFERWCENPAAGGSTWSTYIDNLCVHRAHEVWDDVMWAGANTIPAGATSMRVTLYSGVDNALQWGVSHSPLFLESLQSSQRNEWIYHTGTGSSTTNVGQTVTQGIGQFVIDHAPCYPFLVKGGGYEPFTTMFCCKIEFLAPGSSSYELPAATERTDIELPSGTGATLDQLEVKLDFVQQHLRRTAGNLFNLDPTTMSSVGGNVTGELLDAVGLLVTISGRPSWAGRFPEQPDRFRGLAQLALGNESGWWPSIAIEHEQTNIIPLPPGATKFSLDCMPPMTGAVTLYRPTT